MLGSLDAHIYMRSHVPPENISAGRCDVFHLADPLERDQVWNQKLVPPVSLTIELRAHRVHELVHGVLIVFTGTVNPTLLALPALFKRRDHIHIGLNRFVERGSVCGNGLRFGNDGAFDIMDLSQYNVAKTAA